MIEISKEPSERFYQPTVYSVHSLLHSQFFKRCTASLTLATHSKDILKIQSSTPSIQWSVLRYTSQSILFEEKRTKTGVLGS